MSLSHPGGSVSCLAHHLDPQRLGQCLYTVGPQNDVLTTIILGYILAAEYLSSMWSTLERPGGPEGRLLYSSQLSDAESGVLRIDSSLEIGPWWRPKYISLTVSDLDHFHIIKIGLIMPISQVCFFFFNWLTVDWKILWTEKPGRGYSPWVRRELDMTDCLSLFWFTMLCSFLHKAKLCI